MSFAQRLLAVFFALSGVVLLGTQSPVLASQGETTCSAYTTRFGDTAASVATQFGVTPAQLAQENQAVIIAEAGSLLPGIALRVCAVAPQAAAHARAALAVAALADQPCQSAAYWPSGGFDTDTTPPGCYAGDYRINPRAFPQTTANFGGCDWWPRALHPTWDIWSLPKHTTPKVGAAIWFAGGEQGAASEGHWGVVIAISANGHMILSSEMNTTYYNRFGTGGTQGGFGHVIYRYIWNDPPRTLYVYP